MINEEKLLVVARYLEGDMELQEKQEFEISLQTDLELQGIVADYKNVHQTLQLKIAPAEADKQVEATLAALNNQYFKVQTIKTHEPETARVVPLKSYIKWLSVAAVLIVGLFIWAPWSAGLYEKYAISREMSVAERGTEQNALDQAAQLYNKRDYAAARKILQKEYTLNPGNSLLAYYFAITLIETSKEHEARTILVNLYQGASAFKYDAAYNIALSYVKEGNKPAALEWLAKITKGTANYDKAQELMVKLK